MMRMCSLMTDVFANGKNVFTSDTNVLTYDTHDATRKQGLGEVATEAVQGCLSEASTEMRFQRK